MSVHSAHRRDRRRAGSAAKKAAAEERRLPLIHPGEILRDDFLMPMKISVYTLAQAIKVPRSRVNDIVPGAARDEPTGSWRCPRQSMFRQDLSAAVRVTQKTEARRPLAITARR
jgi:hypothetical protein